MVHRSDRQSPFAHAAKIVAALTLVVVGLSACDTTPPTLEGTLSIGAQTAPAGVVVSVYASDTDTLIAQSATDRKGRYRFTSAVVPTGNYRIGFGDGTYWQGAQTWADATTVHVTTDPVTEINATIAAPASSIGGTLTRRSGRPLVGATVNVIAQGVATAVATTTTDSDGNFAFTGLSAMDATLQVKGAGYETVYMGDTPLLSDATVVHFDGVNPSDPYSTSIAPEGQITGQYVGSSSGWASVFAVAYDKATGEYVGLSPIGSFGDFTIGGLAAGTYTVGIGDATGKLSPNVIGATSADRSTGTGYVVNAGSNTRIGQHTAAGIDCPPNAKSAIFTGRNFRGARLSGCDFANAKLQNVDMSGADLTGANFATADLTGANLRGTNLTSTSFFVANLTGADLSGATMNRTQFRAAGIQSTNFGTGQLSGIRSGQLAGTPAQLPAGWSVINGYFVGPGADLSGADLTNLDLSGRDLRNASIWSANLSSANLTGANLSGANLSNAILSGANITNATLTGTGMTGIDGRGVIGSPQTLPSGWVQVGNTLFGPAAKVTGADVAGADLSAADLVRIESGQLTGSPAALPTGWAFADGFIVGAATTITGANIDGIDLANVDLKNVTTGGLTGTPAALPTGWILYNGYLVGKNANLSGAKLAGISLPGADLSSMNFISADLTGADLSGANLRGTHFDVANLTNADLSHTDMTGGGLHRATISGTDFSGATMTRVQPLALTGTPASLPVGWVAVGDMLVGPGAYLAAATITNADLSGADLTGTDFNGATLTSVNLSGTELTNAVLTNANLQDVTISGADFTDALLTGIKTQGLIGVPLDLPPGWIIQSGKFVPPNG